MEIDINFASIILGAVLGLAGWVSGRDKGVEEVAKWRAGVDAKLDILLNAQKNQDETQETLKTNVQGFDIRMVMVENTLKNISNLNEKFALLENKTDKLHKRLDDVEKVTK